MNDWVPDLSKVSGPRYLAFVHALRSDIAEGALAPGAQLLPQRDMAQRLGLSVGTISKAYAEAEAKGLITGEVGRGTFVQRKKAPARYAPAAEATINLALNVPPHTGEDDLIAATLSEILEADETIGLLGYTPHQGLPTHRERLAQWLATLGYHVDAGRVYITHGAQHALSVALNVAAQSGDTIITECFTYSGMIALSRQNGYRLHGLRIDAEGLIPDVLDKALGETGARFVYSMPTLHTPTGAVMSIARREAIAAIIQKHDASLFEDDAYGYLVTPPLPPISSLIPERSFFAQSFAKCLAPGLRIAALVAPDSCKDRVINAIRTTGWMAVPMMAEVVARIIASGSMQRQAQLKREKAALRQRIARRALDRWLPASAVAASGFHLWLPLPEGRTIDALITQAAQAGLTLSAPSLAPGAGSELHGVRLCLGSPATEQDLEEALSKLRTILESAETISFV